jgi:hypothetical protein
MEHGAQFIYSRARGRHAALSVANTILRTVAVLVVCERFLLGVPPWRQNVVVVLGRESFSPPHFWRLIPSLFAMSEAAIEQCTTSGESGAQSTNLCATPDTLYGAQRSGRDG